MATMTADERRAGARRDYDAFLAMCPSRMLLDRVSGKWVTLILCALGGEHPDPDGSPTGGGPRPMRFSALSRQIAGVSQKMLTQTLRSMEQDGLVTRTVTPTVPVTVTYELTDLGESLRQVVRTLKDWAEENMDTVLAHRASHETRDGPAPAGDAPTV